MSKKLLLPPLPKSIKKQVANGTIYVLFLSPEIWELSKGTNKSNGVWELSSDEYESAKLILKENIAQAQFLIIASYKDIQSSANVFFDNGKITSSPFLQVQYELEKNHLTLTPTVFSDTKLKYHFLTEGVPDSFREETPLEFKLSARKKIDDFVLTITAVFEDKTSTSYPLKIFINPVKNKLKKVLSVIYDFGLKQEKNAFLETIVIKNLPQQICLSKGIRKSNNDWVLTPRDLKNVQITCADSKLSSIVITLIYSYVKNSVLEKHEKTYKINLKNENTVFNDCKCINCENKSDCKLLDVLKYEYPYSPYLKYIEE